MKNGLTPVVQSTKATMDLESQKYQKEKDFMFVVGLIVLAVFSRLIPHPWNFTAVGATALFGGSYISSKKLSLLLPLGILFLSDLILGFHETMIYVYGAFLLTVLLGWVLRKDRAPIVVAGSSMLASCLFFLITNLGVWLSGDLYSKDMSGLVNCFTLALPFFGNQIAGDLLFSAVLFGSYELARRHILNPAPAYAK